MEDTILMEHQKSCLYMDYNGSGGNDKQLKAILDKYPCTLQRKKLVDSIFESRGISSKEVEAIRDKEMENALLELKMRLREYGKVLVYGAGEVGRRIFCLLEESAVDVIKAFVVNKLSGNVSRIGGVAVENYRNHVGGEEKIVIALLDNCESEKVRLKLLGKGICAGRVVLLRGDEKQALMKKLEIPF